MFFKKKKRMIDVRELQKRGIVHPPKKDNFVPTNSDGFVELNSSPSTINNQPSTNFDPFGLMEKSQPTTSELQDTGISQKLINLDNKLYKLEQRVELLEKKLNVNQKLGSMGW